MAITEKGTPSIHAAMYRIAINLHREMSNHQAISNRWLRSATKHVVDWGDG
jgi:hypothetical protein